MRQLRRRFPEEPYRQRLGAIAERIRRTRAALTGEAGARPGGYAGAAALDAELASLQHALVADGLGRVAWGEVAELRWQLATFGFHLASLEVRQHAAVHRAALEALAAGAGPDAEVAAGRHGRRGAGDVPRDRAAPGEVRRRGVPAVRHLVHDEPRRRRGGAGARAPGRGARAVRPAGRRPHRPAAGPARPRRRPAARERRRPVAARPSSSTACSRTRPTAPTSEIAATPRR